MSSSKKSEVFLQLIFVTIAVLIAAIIGGVCWIRSLNAHMKTMEEDIKASKRDELVYQQQPVDIVEGQEVPDCQCAHEPPGVPTWKCGDGTDCAPDERIHTIKPCDPLECKPQTEFCVPDDSCCTAWENVCDDDPCCGWNVQVGYPFLQEEEGIENFDYDNNTCLDGHRLQSRICQMGGKVHRCIEDETCIFTCLPESLTSYKEDWCWAPTQPFEHGTNDIQVQFVNNCPGGTQPPPTDDRYCYAHCKAPFILKNNSCECPPCFVEKNEGCELQDIQLIEKKSQVGDCDEQRYASDENFCADLDDFMGTGIFAKSLTTCNGEDELALAWLNHRWRGELDGNGEPNGPPRTFGGADDYEPDLITICRKTACNTHYIQIDRETCSNSNCGSHGSDNCCEISKSNPWRAIGGGYQNHEASSNNWTHTYRTHPIGGNDYENVREWRCDAGSNSDVDFECFAFFAKGINGAILHTKLRVINVDDGDIKTAECPDSHPILLGGGYRSHDHGSNAPSWLVSQPSLGYNGWQCGISSDYEISCFAVCGKIVLED